VPNSSFQSRNKAAHVLFSSTFIPAIGFVKRAGSTGSRAASCARQFNPLLQTIQDSRDTGVLRDRLRSQGSRLIFSATSRSRYSSPLCLALPRSDCPRTLPGLHIWSNARIDVVQHELTPRNKASVLERACDALLRPPRRSSSNGRGGTFVTRPRLIAAHRTRCITFSMDDCRAFAAE